MLEFKHTKKIEPLWLLWSAILCYTILFSILVLWKYAHFYYDNLDLAIFNNVFWNTLHGHWFQASIHPPSYLGDHFSPSLFLLMPFYALAPTPQTLLILQTVALGLSAQPIYLISEYIVGKERKWMPLFISMLWLVNPLVHNMNFFEFELMSFAVLGLLWTIWAYLKEKPTLFIIASLFTLGMREDFVCIFFVFSILALLDKRSLFWKLYPILSSAAWGILAFWTISLYAPQNSYKFLRYYDWLGGTTLWSIIASFALHPIQVLAHLTTWYNLEFVLGLLFPFFFFVSFRNRYSLLLIPPAAQILLAGFGGSGLILGTYYAGYLVAILFLLFALQVRDFDFTKLPGWLPVELRSRRVLSAIIACAALYAAATYGSISTALAWWQKPHELVAKEHMLAALPSDAAVATTYSLLPTVSSRQYVYLFPYAAIGKNQFALSEYALPENTEYLLIDWDEMVLAQMHFSQNAAFSPYADTVPKNLRTILSQFSIIRAEGPIYVLQRATDAGTVQQLAALRHTSQTADAAATITQVSPDADHIAVTIALPQKTNTQKYYYLEVSDASETFRLPLGYDLFGIGELDGASTVHMPVFIGPATKNIMLRLYAWSKGSIELSGIKSIHPTSDATEISSYSYNTTR